MKTEMSLVLGATRSLASVYAMSKRRNSMRCNLSNIAKLMLAKDLIGVIQITPTEGHNLAQQTVRRYDDLPATGTTN